MKTPKKQPHQQALKLCFTIAILLSWSLGYGQTPVPSKSSFSKDNAVSINSNNDDSGTNYPNEYIYFRSGEDNNDQWMTHAQMVVGDDWIRTRKPLQFLIGNDTWSGSGNSIANSKLLDYSRNYGLSFTAGGTERMTIDGVTGRIGINTTNPDHRLHVVGWTKLMGSVGIGVDADISYPLTIKNSTYGMKYQAGSDTNPIVYHVTTSGTGSNRTIWLGTKTNHGLHIGTNNIPRMTFNTDGNVGIHGNLYRMGGDLNYNGDFEYDYNVTRGAYTAYRQGMASAGSAHSRTIYNLQLKHVGNDNTVQWTDAFRLGVEDTDGRTQAEFFGNVGIGTGSPESGLHVKDQDGGIIVENNNTKVAMDVNDTNDSGWIGTKSNDRLHIGTNNIPRMTFNTDGNVGIHGNLYRMGGDLNYNGDFEYDYNVTRGAYTAYRQGMASAGSTYSRTIYNLQLKYVGNDNTVQWTDAFRLGVEDHDGRTQAEFFGNVGIGTGSPESGLHVKDQDGGIIVENSDIQVMMDINGSSNAGWMGTLSNHGLFLGTNSDGSNIYLDTHDNAFIGFEDGDLPDLSSSNRENFDLLVDEGIIAEDLAIAERADWADYVFDEAYELKPLDEVQRFIEENHHLPNIPSQKEVSEKGYSVHDVNIRFLEKIEELVLYTIQQEEKIEAQENKIEEQELKMDELSKKLDYLAKLIANNK